jgi:hypothetical protein
MSDIARQPPKGAFLSFLDYMDEFAQVPKNLLRGNLGAAGRHTANILGNTLDAALPGDWLPDFREEGDDVSSADLVGIDDKEHPLLAGATNFVGDTLLNPLTYIPGGLLAKGAGKLAGAAAAGISKLPEGEKILEGADAAGRLVRRTFGAQKISPETRSILDKSRAAGQESRAGIDAIKAGPIGKLTEPEAQTVGDIMDNLRWDGGKAQTLAKDSVTALDRIAAHPGVTPENQEKITAAIKQAIDIGQNQAKRPGIFKLHEPDYHVSVLPGGKVSKINTAPELANEYLARSWTGQTEEQALAEALGREPAGAGAQNATKELKLKTPDQINDFMAQNPGMEFERNAAVRMAKRAESQGVMASRAEIGRSVLGQHFAYADPEAKAQVVKTIEGMAKASPEDAQMLMDGFKGIGPRGNVMSALAGMNGLFKKFAVYGAIVPKFGAAVRNKMSGVWQAVADPGARGVAGGQAKRLGSDLYGALTDGLEQGFGIKLQKDALGRKLRVADEAFANSAGSAENAYKHMEAAGHDDMAALFRAGISDGYVRSEDLLKEMARKPWQKGFNNILNWPGSVFRGVEDRMRLGMGLDLMAKGKTAEEAAKITSDSLYSYAVASKENRAARDIIPFFQFSAKAIPQTAKFMAEKPAVATALASAMAQSGGDGALYPYMEGKLNVPIGRDEKGNDQYVSGFGLPFEALSQIPNPSGSLQDLGRDVKRNVIGSSNPLIKTAFSVASGQDPYFETPFGSYDKVPLIGSAGGPGRLYNEVASTGLIQPLTQPLSIAGKIADDRHGAATKALDLLTGANVVSVDPDVALQQQLQQSLQTNPAVQQYRGFFNQSKDPQTQALLEAYKAAKGRVKAKRQAASPQAGPGEHDPASL